MELKFYKKTTRPTNLTEGSIWFNPTTKRIELATGGTTSDVYGSDIQDATYANNVLKITKIDGSSLEINLSNYASSSDISSLESSLASKLNKIKVNNSVVDSSDLNIVGGGGTSVTNSNGTITISSESAVTSVNGQTGDVTITGSEPLIYTASSWTAFNSLFNKDDMDAAISANQEIWIKYGSSIYKYASHGTSTGVEYYYFSCSYANKIYTLTAQYSTIRKKWTNSNTSATADYPSIATRTYAGIVIIGDGIDVASDGTISVDLSGYQTALTSGTTIKTINGESILGSGNITISAGTSYTLPTASDSKLGGVKIPSSGVLDIDTSGNLTVPTASTSALGVVKTGTNITNTNGTISVPTASSTTAGVVKIGSGLTISSGVLSTNLTIPTKTSDLTNDSGFITGVPKASSTVSGTVKAGSGLEVDSNGVLNVLTGSGIVINAETGELEASVESEDYANFSQNIIPAANRMYSLGTEDKPWYNTCVTQLRIIPLVPGTTDVKITSASAETWTFTLLDGSTVTKKMILNSV